MNYNKMLITMLPPLIVESETETLLPTDPKILSCSIFIKTVIYTL